MTTQPSINSPQSIRTDDAGRCYVRRIIPNHCRRGTPANIALAVSAAAGIALIMRMA